MKHFQLLFSDLSINRDDIYLNLGYGGTSPDTEITQMVEDAIAKASEISHPSAAYLFCEGAISSKSYLTLNEVQMKIGIIIGRNLNTSSRFALFVATAGIDYDEYLHHLKHSDDILTQFLADAIGSEIAEATVRYVTRKIADEVQKDGLFITNSYSPGYCSWNVREQKQLFSMFPDSPCGIVLNDSCLMHPVKSVSGLVGITLSNEFRAYSCDICTLKTCYKRKEKVT